MYLSYLLEPHRRRCEEKGHDSIFCNGLCQEWIHRQCSGLSKANFQSVLPSSNCFYCTKCVIDKQLNDISKLKQKVAYLMEAVSKIQPVVSSVSLPVSSPILFPKLGIPSGTTPPATRSARDRKFNLVLYGINKSSKSTPSTGQKLQSFLSLTD